MSRVLRHSQAGGTARLVLLVIASHESEERGAFPSVDTIAAECRMSVRAVQDCIKRCSGLGELRVEQNAGPLRTNLYRVMISEPVVLPGMVQNLHPADARRESAPELKELTDFSSSGSMSTVSHLRAEGADRGISEEFDRTFWPVYPRKLSKGAARRAYVKARRSVQLVTLMEALERAKIGTWADRPMSKIPYPATWLNAEGWLDEPEESDADAAERMAAEILAERGA